VTLVGEVGKVSTKAVTALLMALVLVMIRLKVTGPALVMPAGEAVLLSRR
jgi:hypothetical protein